MKISKYAFTPLRLLMAVCLLLPLVDVPSASQFHASQTDFSIQALAPLPPLSPLSGIIYEPLNAVIRQKLGITWRQVQVAGWNPFFGMNNLAVAPGDSGNFADLWSMIYWIGPALLIAVGIWRWHAATRDNESRRHIGHKLRNELIARVNARRKQALVIGSVGIVLAGVGGWFHFHSPGKHARSATERLSTARTRSPIIRRPVETIPENRLHDKEFIRQKILDSLKQWNYFEDEIARIDPYLGLTQDELKTAVAAFKQFIEEADISDQGYDGQTISVFNLTEPGKIEPTRVLTYNPDVIAALLEYPSVFWHEAVHFAVSNKKRSDRIAEINRPINDYINKHTNRAAAEEFASSRNTTKISLEDIVAHDLWDMQSLRNAPLEQELLGELLQLHWQSEIEAFYFQTAFLAAESASTAPDAALDVALQQPLSLPDVHEFLREIATDFQPGTISESILEKSLFVAISDPIIEGYLIAYRQAVMGEPFDRASVQYLKNDPVARRDFMIWAQDHLLRRESRDASRTAIPVAQSYWRHRIFQNLVSFQFSSRPAKLRFFKSKA